MKKTTDASPSRDSVDVQDAQVADDLEREQGSNDLLEDSVQLILQKEHGKHRDLERIVYCCCGVHHVLCGSIVRHLSWNRH